MFEAITINKYLSNILIDVHLDTAITSLNRKIHEFPIVDKTSQANFHDHFRFQNLHKKFKHQKKL